MGAISPVSQRYFPLRLGAALISLGGFWLCLARVQAPPGEFVQEQGRLGKPNLSDTPERVSGDEPSPGAPQASAVEPTVMIDPGHGGLDGGTVGNGLLEKDWTLKVGLALAEELRWRGHAVRLTRGADDTLPLLDRPAVVNGAPRVALLSIHFNAGSADASGVETWYSWPKKPEIMARLHDAAGLPVEGTLADDGQRLAMAVQSALHQRTGARDRGIKNGTDLAITSRTVCPAILIECGFLSNGAESRKIQELAYRKKLVRGIADGYEAWLKSRDTPLVTTTPIHPSRDAPAAETVIDSSP